MNTAIIVAAGSGRRFESEIPKQFLSIFGKPVLIHTLEKFEACGEIAQIVLVLAADQIEAFQSISLDHSLTKLVKTVAGGNTRARSVFGGLQAADKNSQIVVVHDGARPLVSTDEIAATIRIAEQTGAACLVAPVTDTIKQVNGSEIIGTLDRNNLRRALTPQAFRYEILQNAFAASDLSDKVTDECFLVEKLGHRITFVEGSARNIKVTYPDDLILAEAFLRP